MYKAVTGALLAIMIFFGSSLGAGAGKDGTAVPEAESTTVMSEESEEQPESGQGEEESGLQDSGFKKDRTLLLVACIAGGAAALIAVSSAIWVIHRKKAGQDTEKTEAGIPLRLEVYAGKCKNKASLLRLQDCLVIGSAADCDIIFDDPEVADKNSCIRLAEGQIYIEDLGSSMGTALDGMRFQGRNRLRGGEVISIGSVEFSILFDNMQEYTQL